MITNSYRLKALKKGDWKVTCLERCFLDVRTSMTAEEMTVDVIAAGVIEAIAAVSLK